MATALRRARNERVLLRKLFRTIEWGGTVDGEPACHVCDRKQSDPDGHRPKCYFSQVGPGN